MTKTCASLVRTALLLWLASAGCAAEQQAEPQPSAAMPGSAETSPAKPSEPMQTASAGSAAEPSVMPAADGGMREPAPAPAMVAAPMNGDHTVPAAFMGDAGEGWKTLIAGSWEVPAGQETYHCVRFTLPETITVKSFRALTPFGTHHTLLTIVDDPTEADGSTPCSASTNGRRSITGSGVGSNDLNMPDGVAMQVKAGQQLLLNLHLFNVTDKPIKGTSGTLFKPMSESDVKEYAEGVLAGPTSLSLPPGGPTTVSGNCTMTHDSKLFAISPHMHQLGIHLKAVAHSTIDGDVVLHDGPYSFDEQLVYPLEKEVSMKKGDTVRVDCTYRNTTDKTVMFGESTLSEMCFAGLYRYPGGDPSFSCFR